MNPQNWIIEKLLHNMYKGIERLKIIDFEKKIK